MQTTSDKEHGRILIVEDDPALRAAYQRVLAREGWTVDTTRDGLEAQERMKSATFDAIVSDIHMPGYGGIEFLRRVREHDAEIPVVLVTGKPSIDSTIRAIEYRAFRYLVKPVINDVLASVVRNAVRASKASHLRRQLLDEKVVPLEPPQPIEEPTAPVSLDRALSRALTQLWVAYQPIVSWGNRAVIGYEALLRTSEPAFGGPQDLLAVADGLGRLHEVGRTVRARIAETIHQLPQSARLFVNVHARDLDDPQLADSCAHFSGMAHRIVLEITERASLSSVEDLAQRLKTLKQVGFRIAVDDTGAGYGGLTTFAHLEPDVVKLGMNLVRGVDREPRKQVVVRSIVHLCAELRIVVVAEGVETPAERAALAELGCDAMQGHLFAKPDRGFPAPVW